MEWRWWLRAKWNGRNDRQPEHQGRFGNNNNNWGESALEERLLEVIDRRTRNHVGATGSRGTRANDIDDSPIREKISLSRRNSRRNVRTRTTESLCEDFPPLSKERPREDHENHQSCTSRREGNDINRTWDHEIEALRKKIESLERERNGEQVNKPLRFWNHRGKFKKRGSGPGRPKQTPDKQHGHESLHKKSYGNYMGLRRTIGSIERFREE